MRAVIPVLVTYSTILLLEVKSVSEMICLKGNTQMCLMRARVKTAIDKDE